VLYVSATGATTVQNLAYAARLGLWGTGDFPFATRADFVAAMEKGGVAAMEVLARDLKALGLYAARSLSFEGRNAAHKP
jgi:protein strawberry notch